MTYAAMVQPGSRSANSRDFSPTLVPSAVFCAVVLASCASLVHWMASTRAPIAPAMNTNPALVQTWVLERPRAMSRAVEVVPLPPAHIEARRPPAAETAAAWAGAAPAAPSGGTLLANAAALIAQRQHFASGVAFNVPVDTPPARTVPPVPEISERIPVPLPRPASLSPPRDEIARIPDTAKAPDAVRQPGRRRLARLTVAPPVATAPEDNRSFFDKLFGVTQQPSNTTAIAYAPRNGGLDSGLGGIFGRTSRYDGQTAIYEIATHTVYLPDGRKLEAHSGLGAGLDNPRSVNQRMRGATPPNVYALAPRGELFHGVRALRLTPIGSGTTYGRDGLLAHTFMLGARGDSNGCVVFRDYQSFLQAFESGAIKRLAVVASLN